MFQAIGGVYPTMITPYREGKIDFSAVEALVEWYWKEGCDGIFAACQSSEIRFLSLEERVELTKTVLRKARELAEKDKSRPPMSVVASGHVSDRFEDQVTELNAIAALKPDALILISNRMDIANTSEQAWIADAEKLLQAIDPEIPLGVYECPQPYKRLLTDGMIRWCIETGRFHFIKDTCCDATILRRRLDLCRDTPLKIFNANAQTLLQSLKDGAHGYCGVMANIHPSLYRELIRTHSEQLQGYLGLSAMLEGLTYPVCAKYYLDRHEGVSMEYDARSASKEAFTPYQRDCIDQFATLDRFMKDHLTR